MARQLQKKRRGNSLFWILLLVLIIAGYWYYANSDIGIGQAAAKPTKPVLIAVDDTAHASAFQAATAASREIKKLLGKTTVESRLFSELVPKDLTKWKLVVLISSKGTPTNPDIVAYSSVNDRASAKFVQAANVAMQTIRPASSQMKLHSEMTLYGISGLW
jgi:hypothetical protein